MKLTLEFDETERDEHEICCRAIDLLILLDDIDSELRSAIDHESGAFAKCDSETIEKIRDWIWNERNDRRIPEFR